MMYRIPKEDIEWLTKELKNSGWFDKVCHDIELAAKNRNLIKRMKQKTTTMSKKITVDQAAALMMDKLGLLDYATQRSNLVTIINWIDQGLSTSEIKASIEAHIEKIDQEVAVLDAKLLTNGL